MGIRRRYLLQPLQIRELRPYCARLIHDKRVLKFIRDYPDHIRPLGVGAEGQLIRGGRHSPDKRENQRHRSGTGREEHQDQAHRDAAGNLGEHECGDETRDRAEDRS